MARVLFGVSGGIAAYKALETARLAVRAGHAVRVIQTEDSTRFVGTASFAAITGAPVLVDDFEPDPARGAYPGETFPANAPISHLALVERAGVYLIAPATANTVAKLAHGLADNLLTAAALAARCPVVVAPAMNAAMYEHAAVQANLGRLGARGVTVLSPGEGDLASHGEHGVGRLPEPADLLAALEAALTRSGTLTASGTLTGRRVLVTAGGTREPIDSVRYIGNRSSGKMGFALAAEAARRGASVTVIAANVALEAPPSVRVIDVRTAAEMLDACEREFPACDMLLMAAAVADFRPATPAAGKIKKDFDPADPPPAIQLETTVDILATLAQRRRPGQVVVGFAAEHGPRALSYAYEKRRRKGLDAIVVNDISRPEVGFDAAENEVTIITAAGERHVPRASKALVAAAVLDEAELLDRTEEGRGLDGALGAAAGSAAGV